MIAKFEKRISPDSGQTSVRKYKNLHNLLHWHMEHEIIFVSEGTVELNVNNRFYTLKPGMCAFIKSEEIHCINGTANSITHVIKSSAPAILQITKEKSPECPVIKNNDTVIERFIDVEKELKRAGEYCGIIADCIVTCLVAEIFRTERVCTENDELRNSEKYKELLKWITNNYNHISFEDAAKHMNFSKAYFSKYFQDLTGIKFTRYLNILKVSAAIDKIKGKESNMTEISLSCGFGTIRNFNRVFKNLTGYAPKSLPKNYVFLYTITDSDNIGFDPTLNCSEIVE